MANMQDETANHPDEGASVRVHWLGQAGFLVEAEGKRLAIDPYLSDVCDSIYGLERRVAAPVPARSLEADVVLVTHWHEDHFDLPTLVIAIARGATIIAPMSCLDRLAGRGVDIRRCLVASPGTAHAVHGFTVVPVAVSHRVPGYLTEDAVGFLVEVAGVAIFHSGDTEYDRAITTGVARHLDVALLCTNGSGGNMNVLEAAVLARQLDADVIVPMHFGMWADDAYGPGATLDPRELEPAYRALGGSARVAIPTMAAPLTLLPAGAG